MLGVPGMAVPIFTVVNLGLALAFMGGGVLLVIAVWWTWASDGIEIPRQHWPNAARFGAMAGWALWLGGLAVLVAGMFGHVGVARW